MGMVLIYHLSFFFVRVVMFKKLKYVLKAPRSVLSRFSSRVYIFIIRSSLKCLKSIIRTLEARSVCLLARRFVIAARRAFVVGLTKTAVDQFVRPFVATEQKLRFHTVSTLYVRNFEHFKQLGTS